MQNWEEERRIKKKLGETREYRFGVRRGAGVQGQGKSPVVGQQGQMMEEETVDPREVDALLGEMALMSGRWQLLRRFLYGRLKVRFSRVLFRSRFVAC